MIEAERLSKYYGPVPAILDVSFRVDRGEILGLLGPNGAGKTTTMRILTGFLPATSGQARVAGFDVGKQSLEVRKRLGYLPEMAPLYPDLTPLDYLEFVGKLKGIPRGERDERIDEVIETCRIEEVADKLIGKLSKGYRQRVGIAQALLHDPEVLILDEPTVGLDPRQVIETRQLIKSLGGERSIILSTHNLHEVSMICQRVVFIKQGRVAGEHRLGESDRLRVEIRGALATVRGKLLALENVVKVDQTSGDGQGGSIVIESKSGADVRARVAATIVGSGCDLLEMRPSDLEEVYMKVMAEEAA